ncbi:MAG: DUF2474 family protein [Sphingomonadales bacterium]|nr:DUF2474 family protein [Sphingomonadales bacterium]
MAGGLRKVGWFIAIYGGSVLVLGAVSFILRFWLRQ